MLGVLFTTSTFLEAPQSTRFTTLKYWNIWGTPSDAKGQNCGEVTTDFSITATLQPTQHSELVSFWPKTRSLFFPPFTHLTLLLVTFSCSQNLKNPSKEEDLRRFRRLRQMRRRSWKPSQRKRTRTVPRSENTVSLHFAEFYIWREIQTSFTRVRWSKQMNVLSTSTRSNMNGASNTKHQPNNVNWHNDVKYCAAVNNNSRELVWQ